MGRARTFRTLSCWIEIINVNTNTWFYIYVYICDYIIHTHFIYLFVCLFIIPNSVFCKNLYAVILPAVSILSSCSWFLNTIPQLKEPVALGEMAGSEQGKYKKSLNILLCQEVKNCSKKKKKWWGHVWMTEEPAWTSSFKDQMDMVHFKQK